MITEECVRESESNTHRVKISSFSSFSHTHRSNASMPRTTIGQSQRTDFLAQQATFHGNLSLPITNYYRVRETGIEVANSSDRLACTYSVHISLSSNLLNHTQNLDVLLRQIGQYKELRGQSEEAEDQLYVFLMRFAR